MHCKTPWEDLFTAGRFTECSRVLDELLNAKAEDNEADLSLDKINLFYYYRHNKTICDALCHDWQDRGNNRLQELWITTFLQFASLAETLRCELLVSNVFHEVFLVSTLNLLWWSWKNFNDNLDGLISKVEQLTINSLQAELSASGERALESENVLDVAEPCVSCLLRIPPRRCHVILDILSLYFLLSLRNERHTEVLNRSSSLLNDVFNVLPQIRIHLTSGTPSVMNNAPPLFRLGPNIASSSCDPDISLNVFATVHVIYLLRLKRHDEAWAILQDNILIKIEKIKFVLDYLRAFVSVKLNDLDRGLYYVTRASAVPMTPLMIKRRNILCGWICLLKKDYKAATEHFRDRDGMTDDEEQLPIHVFLMSQAHGSNEPELQLTLLDFLKDVLGSDPLNYADNLYTLSSIEERLLWSVHKQPEVTYLHTLLAVAECSIKVGVETEASEYFLEALKIMKCNPECLKEQGDFCHVPSLQDVMRKAIVSLLRCNNPHKALIICRKLQEAQSLESGNYLDQAITLLLLVDAQTIIQTKQTLLSDAAKLLQKQRNLSAKNEGEIALIDTLLSRTFYRKAKLNAERGFDDDATVYFKRALALNKGDKEVIEGYRLHLLNSGNRDEAANVLKYGEVPALQLSRDVCPETDVTLDYLLKQ